MALPPLGALAAVFDAMGTDWAVVGGHAANVYRDEPRLTGDVDLMLLATEAEMSAIAEAFRERGWQVSHRPGDQWLVRLQHPMHGRADLIAAETEYQKGAIRRARRSPLRESGDAKVIRAEDVVILKLIAHRYRDDDDVASILAAGAPLDCAYLQRWLVAWDLLERYQGIVDRVRKGCDED